VSFSDASDEELENEFMDAISGSLDSMEDDDDDIANIPNAGS
jgi:hypothetical protein